MNDFVSFDGLGSTFLHNIYGSSKGKIRTELVEEDLEYVLGLFPTGQKLEIRAGGS